MSKTTLPATDTLMDVMSQPFEWFEGLGKVTHSKPSRRHTTARHIYIDRGSNVLGVAHLDSVQNFLGLWFNDYYLSCSTVDNRMGAWLMLYGLPALGFNFDVLLTENEESGCSTAADFTPSKQYNWGFSFDRTGTDVACYQYMDKDTEFMLNNYELEAQYGSYSDVADLDLGCKCFNFGVGMYNYHSEAAYVKLWELTSMVDRFGLFFNDHDNTLLPHNGGGRWSSYDDCWENGEPEWYTQYKANMSIIKAGSDEATYGYLTSKKDHLFDYYTGLAQEEPFRFFTDTDDPQDWWANHTMGDLNESHMEDEVFDAYVNGFIKNCDVCDNLFVEDDVRRYPTFEARLCKACFHALVTSSE